MVKVPQVVCTPNHQVLQSSKDVTLCDKPFAATGKLKPQLSGKFNAMNHRASADLTRNSRP
jgi:hypothetical protein